MTKSKEEYKAIPTLLSVESHKDLTHEATIHMSTRPQALYPVITNGNMASNLTSQVSIIQKLSMMSYTLSWAGTSPVGTVSVQVSNDYSLYENGSVRNAGTWTSLPLSYNGSSTTTIPVSGNTGSGQIDIDQLGAFAVRLIYTAGSGTGSLQVTYCAKVS